MLKVKVQGRLKRQGLTALFFESAEPTFGELDPVDFFKRFPEGIYEIEGVTLDGDAIIGHHTVNALGEIGGDSAISYLSGARYDPNKTIRANAEAILLELGHQAGIN